MNVRALKKSSLAPAAAALLALASLSATAASTDAGMRVARDPETGQLRAPTAEEAQALSAPAAGTSRTAKTTAPRGLITGRVNPPPVVYPDGTIEQELDDSTVMYSVARRGADGKIEMYCVPGKTEADKIVKGQVKGQKLATAKEHQHER